MTNQNRHILVKGFLIKLKMVKSEKKLLHMHGSHKFFSRQ